MEDIVVSFSFYRYIQINVLCVSPYFNNAAVLESTVYENRAFED